MSVKLNYYDNKVVDKPWGHEHVVYRYKKKLCITLLKINFNKSTSLHCHPNKKSGFVLLDGKARFQLGLWKRRSEIHNSPSKRMIARGLFHSIKSISKSGLLALEFETPVNKNDLVRFKDNYGRAQKPYEGKKNIKKINSNFLKFKKSFFEQKKVFKIKNTKLVLETHKNFTKINRSKKDTIFAIIDGSICDYNGRDIITYGDIIKTNDMKTLSKVFRIKKKLSLIRINKF